MSSSNRADVRDFLVTRRARITPQQAGLAFYGGNRRVPGLRREEVAMLAGVSADYYTRLEKGNLTGVSDAVLDAIARALQLNEAERLHLYDLARTASTSPARAARRRTPQQVRPGIRLILDGMTDTPAFVRNGRLDILAANALGRALYSPAFASSARPANLARFRFFDPAARDFYPDFADSARTTVELLRTEAGRDPYNKNLTALIGELSTRSEEFRALWAAHDVRLHRTGIKHFRHPAVGTLDLMFEAMALEADEGLTLTAYTAEPGTPSHDGLQLLASWAATHQRKDDARAARLASAARGGRGRRLWLLAASQRRAGRGRPGGRADGRFPRRRGRSRGNGCGECAGGTTMSSCRPALRGNLTHGSPPPFRHSGATRHRPARRVPGACRPSAARPPEVQHQITYSNWTTHWSDR